MIFMLSISVFANAEKEDNLLNPLQKHITNTDSDDDMIHQITSIRIDEYGKLVIEENHFAKKSNASTCAYRDRLPVSFKKNYEAMMAVRLNDTTTAIELFNG